MGRTRRRRRFKRAQNIQMCRSLILFNAWLMKKGIRCNKKLVIVVFGGCDRGVLTKDKIYPGEELINLPLNLTINVSTLLMDEVFCAIFVNNKTNCLVEYKRSITFQSLLAFYLLFLKVQGEWCKWYLYLESLPRTYTVPYFLPNEVKDYLDPTILKVIKKQREVIDLAYKIFLDVLNSTNCLSRNVIDLKKSLNRAEFDWAYFTVNTRCVYMDLSNLINISCAQTTILELLTDNPSISLCPFLDMINHSPDAKNETKLILNQETMNISACNLEEQYFSETRFAIYTKSQFEANSQVFICYGDSYNLKLVTEYGFFLTSNKLDYVPISFDLFYSFLHSTDIKLSQEQLKFIQSHRLDKDLYIDSNGLSFNLYGLVLVVKYFYRKDVNISKLLYCAALSSYDKELLDIVTPFLHKKLNDTNYSINNLRTFEEDVALHNCIQLMYQFKKLLEDIISIGM